MPLVKNTTYLRKALQTWYRRSARPLPWRLAGTTPYVVMVSEIMLQQTQAARVAELLIAFLQRYPTVHALAQASTADVIRAWKGLGYNNRAVRLRDAARTIVKQHNGVVPRDEPTLKSLPGFGPYTASAVATFAYGARTIVMDVNVRRVYSRLMKKCTSVSSVESDKSLKSFALEIIPRINTSEWYHAVMDLGATICKARAAQCSVCPLQKHCPSANNISRTSKQSPSRSADTSANSEPTFNGTPNRIWRGRVVNVLRNATRPLQLKTVLKRLEIEKPSDAELRWIKSLLVALQKDGIVRLTDQSVVLSDD